MELCLFIDATPSDGFSGFYDGHWFTGSWPLELTNLPPDVASSAAFKVYPMVVTVLSVLLDPSLLCPSREGYYYALA